MSALHFRIIFWCLICTLSEYWKSQIIRKKRFLWYFVKLRKDKCCIIWDIQENCLYIANMVLMRLSQIVVNTDERYFQYCDSPDLYGYLYYCMVRILRKCATTTFFAHKLFILLRTSYELISYATTPLKKHSSAVFLLYQTLIHIQNHLIYIITLISPYNRLIMSVL